MTVYLNAIEKAITVSLFDYAGRLVEQQNPDGTKRKYQYNPDSTIKTSISENGSITYFKYNGLGQRTEQWSPFEVNEGNILYLVKRSRYLQLLQASQQKTIRIIRTENWKM